MSAGEIKELDTGQLAGTKLKIFRAAVDLFYERGFVNVGIRDIAAAVGIKSASIYHHFASKDALLDLIYKYFDQYYIANLPDIDEVIKLIPTTTPFEVFEQLQFAPNNRSSSDFMRRVIAVLGYDGIGRDDIRDIANEIYEINTWRISKLLAAMESQGVIENVNVDLLASIMVRFRMSMLSRSEGLRNLSLQEWRAAIRLLFDMAVVKK